VRTTTDNLMNKYVRSQAENAELRGKLTTVYDLLAEAIDGHPQYDFNARAEHEIKQVSTLLARTGSRP